MPDQLTPGLIFGPGIYLFQKGAYHLYTLVLGYECLANKRIAQFRRCAELKSPGFPYIQTINHAPHVVFCGRARRVTEQCAQSSSNDRVEVAADAQRLPRDAAAAFRSQEQRGLRDLSGPHRTAGLRCASSAADKAPAGVMPRTVARAARFLSCRSPETMPGRMALTRMLWGPSSTANSR